MGELGLAASLALQTAPPAATRKQLMLAGTAHFLGTHAKPPLLEEVTMLIRLKFPVLPTVPAVYMFAPRHVVPAMRKPHGVT